MRILFSTCSAAHYMAPPQLSDEQITCGPYFEDVEIGGRVVSLRTPLGEYDLAKVAARLPADQKPEAVVCLVDASWFNTPHNLAAFRCPKIALVADTHHMAKPIGGMIKYLKSQGFDRHVFLYTRHHLELFRAAGLKNLHWFPGLTFSHGDARVRAARQPQRERRIALVGQTGALHQRRLRLAGALAMKKLPLVLKAVSQHEGLEFYGASLLGLNVTANGDLNLRAFEMMATGTAMLMDRLSPESGLPEIWQDGRDLVTFGSAGELVERAQHLLAHPTEAKAIGEAGARWFDEHFNAPRRRAAFLDLLADGRELPEFTVKAPPSPRIMLPELAEPIAVYEHMQKLHSTQEVVSVRLDETAPADFEWLCSTLPRIQVTRVGARATQAAARPDLIVVGRAQASLPATLAAPRVWCWDATVEDRTRLRPVFESAGLPVERGDFAFYCRPEPETTLTADSKGLTARGLLQMGDRDGAFDKARRTLAENPRCVDSYLVMAELAHETGKQELFGKMLAKVRSLAPADPRAALLEMSVLHDTGKSGLSQATLAVAWRFFDKREWATACSYADRATKADPEFSEAHFVHGLACLRLAGSTGDVEAWRQTGRGLKSLRTAATFAPQREDYWLELAIALRHAGLFDEAITSFEQNLDLEAGNAVARFGLGETLLTAGLVDRAGDVLERGVGQFPGDPQFARWLGHVRKRQGRSTEAWQWHCRSFGVAPPKPSAANGVRGRVVFIVQHPQSWTSTASAYAAFAADSAWETQLVALPYFHPFYTAGNDEKDAIFPFLDKLAVPYVRWDDYRLGPGCADVIFLQNPYDVTRPAGWRTVDVLKCGARIAYIPYGIEIGGGRKNADFQFNQPIQQLAWAVFARSARHKEMFARHCLGGDGHVFVTGHPKMDAQRDLDAARDPELEAFAAGRRLVAWNPQFDVRLNGTAFGDGFSTFLRWREFLPDEFARRQDLAFVIRPHPLFFATMEDRGILTQPQIDRFLGRCADAGNILIDRRKSYLPLFAASSAMLSDASSFLLEYGATGKPLLYLHNPHGPALNSDGSFVRDFCSTAETEAEISRFLDDVTAGRDERGTARRAAREEFMHLPAEGVGVAIKRVVEARLLDEERASLEAKRPIEIEEPASELIAV